MATTTTPEAIGKAPNQMALHTAISPAHLCIHAGLHPDYDQLQNPSAVRTAISATDIPSAIRASSPSHIPGRTALKQVGLRHMHQSFVLLTPDRFINTLATDMSCLGQAAMQLTCAAAVA